jgi:hypothetical protein
MQMHEEHNTETETYYQNRIHLTEQDGWRDLVEELNNLVDIYSNLDSLESDRDLWYAKGQLSILRQVIGLEEATKLAVEQLELF